MKPLPTTLIASSMCSFVSGGDAIEDGRGIDFPSFSANTGGNWPARPRRGARPPPGGPPAQEPADPDREADGEGGEGLARTARVDRGREYDEHKEERDHDLNDHRLERRNRRIHGGGRGAGARGKHPRREPPPEEPRAGRPRPPCSQRGRTLRPRRRGRTRRVLRQELSSPNPPPWTRSPAPRLWVGYLCLFIE